MKLSEWLSEKPYCLALSSGFFGFFAHCGVVSALEEVGLRPQSIVGSSAGALIGGLYASGLSSKEIKSNLFDLRRSDFWDPALGLGLLRGERFLSQLRSYLPVESLEDCPIPIKISTYDVLRAKTHVVEQGDLAQAIVASCSVPLLFRPVFFQGRILLDGGIQDRPGISGANTGHRTLYHHLAQRSLRSRITGRRVPSLNHFREAHVLNLGHLPKVGPFRMSRGREAFAEAYQRTQTQLSSKI